MSTIKFGKKHYGHKFGDVYDNDPMYIIWCLNNLYIPDDVDLDNPIRDQVVFVHMFNFLTYIRKRIVNNDDKATQKINYIRTKLKP